MKKIIMDNKLLEKLKKSVEKEATFNGDEKNKATQYIDRLIERNNSTASLSRQNKFVDKLSSHCHCFVGDCNCGRDDLIFRFNIGSFKEDDVRGVYVTSLAGLRMPTDEELDSMERYFREL